MNFCKGGMKNIGSEEHILDNMLWDLLTLEALTCHVTPQVSYH